MYKQHRPREDLARNQSHFSGRLRHVKNDIDIPRLRWLQSLQLLFASNVLPNTYFANEGYELGSSSRIVF